MSAIPSIALGVIQSPEEALDRWLPNAQAAWTRCLDIGERPELEGGPSSPLQYSLYSYSYSGG